MSASLPSAPSGGRCYHIEEVAERTGLTRRTLRYYEEIGLLDPTARTEGNYRLYTEADITRIEKIRQAKDSLGISLKEIQQLIKANDEVARLGETFRVQEDRMQRRETLDRADVLIRQQLDLVSSKMVALTQLQTWLEERLARHEQLRAEISAEDE